MIRRVIATLALALTMARSARAEDVVAPPALPSRPLPIQVDVIRIEGLVRTDPGVVRREIGFAEGDHVTVEQRELAVTRLWNTTIFARVELHVLVEQGRTVIVVRVEDRWTLNPLFRFGAGGDAVFFRLGAADNNLAGRFLEVQAQYENFDGFHGGQLLFREPRLFGERLELLLQADRLVRPRPGFSDQRTQGIVEVAKLALEDRIRVGLRASIFADRFLPPLDSAPAYPPETDTLAFEPSLRVGRVDVLRLRQRGVSLELRPWFGFVAGKQEKERSVGVTAEALAFLLVGERGNLALRLRGAGVSAVPAHLELFAGGLDLVRGFPDNYVRTQALGLVNLEARWTAFDSTWFAVVPATFFDGVAARAPSGKPGTAASVGCGVRLLVPKFVGTGLRVDVAAPIHANLRRVADSEQSRLGPPYPNVSLGSLQPSFGVYQFF